MRDVTGEEDFQVPFHVATRELGPAVVLVEISGELDLATEPRARAFLAECTRTKPAHLVVDLSGVTFLPSQGLHLLVAAHLNDDSIHGALHLVGVLGNRHVEPQMRITGLLTDLDVRPDLTVLLAELNAD